MSSSVCEWRIDEDGVWNTTCGGRFELNHGTPAENKMRYCPYCGGTLAVVPEPLCLVCVGSCDCAEEPHETDCTACSVCWVVHDEDCLGEDCQLCAITEEEELRRADP